MRIAIERFGGAREERRKTKFENSLLVNYLMFQKRCQVATLLCILSSCFEASLYFGISRSIEITNKSERHKINNDISM